MKSQVFRVDARSKFGRSLPEKLRSLIRRLPLSDRIAKDDLVAVKLHWGEVNNTAYLRPPFARVVVEEVAAAGGRPFVTDTNVLYRASRHDALGNLAAAARNGFTAETLGAPVIIADGLTGRDGVDVPVPAGGRVKSARIASAIHHADALVVLSHVKGHLLFGYGGALKNLGMGCATPSGKHVLHQDLHPTVEEARCTGCRRCGTVCPSEAIVYLARPGDDRRVHARILADRCIGCGECVAVCPDEAIPIRWETSQPPLLEKTAEYAYAAVARKKGKVVYLSALLDVTPDCDCADWSDLPIVPDLGFLASFDPVAIDQAALDLINAAPVAPGSVLHRRQKDPGGDHFLAIHGRPWAGLLDHAERLGLGSRDHDLVEL
jgi:hypothetical protein